MTNKFLAAAALTALIGTGFVAPAFAADPAQPAANATSQAAPHAKAKHAQAGKVHHTAKHKASAKAKPAVTPTK
jgi:hypothetical protein